MPYTSHVLDWRSFFFCKYVWFYVLRLRKLITVRTKRKEEKEKQRLPARHTIQGIYNHNPAPLPQTSFLSSTFGRQLNPTAHRLNHRLRRWVWIPSVIHHQHIAEWRTGVIQRPNSTSWNNRTLNGHEARKPLPVREDDDEGGVRQAVRCRGGSLASCRKSLSESVHQHYHHHHHHHRPPPPTPSPPPPHLPYHILPPNPPTNELPFIILANPSCGAGVGGKTSVMRVEALSEGVGKAVCR